MSPAATKSAAVKITPTLTAEIARASKLQLTDKEVEKFTHDLQEILNAFSVLDTLDVQGVKPSFKPVQHLDVLREDTVKTSLSQEQALSLTKQKENGFFIGPRTID